MTTASGGKFWTAVIQNNNGIHIDDRSVTDEIVEEERRTHSTNWDTICDLDGLLVIQSNYYSTTIFYIREDKLAAS